MIKYMIVNTINLMKNIENIRIRDENDGIRVKVKYGRWHMIPRNIVIDEGFIEGLAYYVGDGRKSGRTLSIVDVDDSAINFFLWWIQKYFGIEKCNVKINEHPNFKEAVLNNAIVKRLFSEINPIAIKLCSQDKNLTSAYIRGIMSAEGSPKYNIASGSRSVHLKMKDKNEINFIHNLLNNMKIVSSVLYSKTEHMWIISISGRGELRKLEEMDVFKLTEKKKRRLENLLNSYKREQVKIGDVSKYYVSKLIELEKYDNEITAPKLARFVNRSRTRTSFVLRKLQRDGLLESERSKKLGTPLMFRVTTNGRRLVDDLSKRF